MRLLVISDLHLERRSISTLYLGPGFDVLVCAGDIWENEPELGIRAIAVLSGGEPAIVVPGNHDHYRRDTADRRAYPDLLAAMVREAEKINAEAGSDRVHVLNGGRSILVGGVRFTGATLWSDWSLAGRWRNPDDAEGPHDGAPETVVAAAMACLCDPETGSREYRGAIQTAAGAQWTPQHAVAAHAADRAALRHALSRHRTRPHVVVTHHPPIVHMMDPYRPVDGVPWWVPAFYGSTFLDDLPEDLRPDLWISGHFHACHDLMCGPTRCTANPVEAVGFDPGFVVEVVPLPRAGKSAQRSRVMSAGDIGN